MVRVALTGNYGSGKSSILKYFREFGAFCINADEIVGELLEDPAVLEKLRKLAGDGVFEGGRLSKKRMADAVFSDSALRKAVEDLMHPMVLARVEELSSGPGSGIVFIEIPLLFEKGYEGMFDKVITVYTEQETALGRLEKAGVPRQEALRRLCVQMPISQKAKRADYVINNEGTPEEARRQARRIYDELKAAA